MRLARPRRKAPGKPISAPDLARSPEAAFAQAARSAHRPSRFAFGRTRTTHRPCRRGWSNSLATAGPGTRLRLCKDAVERASVLSKTSLHLRRSQSRCSSVQTGECRIDCSYPVNTAFAAIFSAILAMPLHASGERDLGRLPASLLSGRTDSAARLTPDGAADLLIAYGPCLAKRDEP